MFRLVCAVLLAAYIGPSASDGQAKDELIITLERTACLAACPVYKLTIRGSGSVTYEGKWFVRVRGMRHETIDQARVKELAQAIVDTGYFDLRDKYDEVDVPPDLPTTYTSIILEGRHKTVEDHSGAPKKLQELESRIDEVTGSKRWVFLDAATGQSKPTVK